MADILLKVKDLQVGYGGIQAVKGVSLEVREGELVSLIGSNGAGKTTTMKAITGSLPLQAGDIEYLGKSIQGQGPWDLVKQGLAMVPKGRGVFTRMSITENLQMRPDDGFDRFFPGLIGDLNLVARQGSRQEKEIEHFSRRHGRRCGLEIEVFTPLGIVDADDIGQQIRHLIERVFKV